MEEFKSFHFFLVYIKWILHLDKSRDRILERIDRMLVSEEALSFVKVKLKVLPNSISDHRPLEGLISLLPNYPVQIRTELAQKPRMQGDCKPGLAEPDRHRRQA